MRVYASVVRALESAASELGDLGFCGAKVRLRHIVLALRLIELGLLVARPSRRACALG
jgi:hypothetical protein